MSKSDEDWDRQLGVALLLRQDIRFALDKLDGWTPLFADIAWATREELEEKLCEAERLANAVVGSLTRWDISP